MSSITTWNRVEPSIRTPEPEGNLEARVHDPLWFLTRQWQLGECHGEDTGSPVLARLRAEVGRIDRFRPGPRDSAAAAVVFDDVHQPLEARVERETGALVGSLAVDAGVHLVRLLRDASLADHVPAFTAFARSDVLPPPDGVMLRRVPDAAALRAEFDRSIGADGTGPLPAELDIPANAHQAVRDVLVRWMRWLDTMLPAVAAADDTWNEARLEYECAVSARVGDDEIGLFVDAFEGGRLDWHDFELDAAIHLDATQPSTSVVRTVLPSPAGFSGMPSPRFWELEDARVDFGAVSAAPDDLLGMLLIEFALVYGNDWFILPVDLATGSLARIDSLVVTDTFGVRTLIRPSGDTDVGSVAWRMFTLGGGAAESLFFLAPARSFGLEGPAREQVVFARDELANLAWAIEEIVENPDGSTRRRADDPYHLPAESPTPLPEGAQLRYRGMSAVPEHWVPLVPVGQPNEPAHRLQMRPLIRATETGPRPAEPLGRILSSASPFELEEEELGREGVRVERVYEFCRWIRGIPTLWPTRRVHAGRGPAYAALQFDRAVAERLSSGSDGQE